MSERLHRLRDVATSRMFVRSIFFVYFIWACWRLWQFAEWARGNGPYVPRPETVAGILPIGHFTSFFAWLKGGGWDTFLPAGLVIIIGAVTISLLFRRGFCGWICPVGTIWEAAALLGRKLMGRNLRVPKWLDLAGRSLRYLLGGAALFFLASVSIQEAVSFRSIPYMWIADIKILQGFVAPMFLLVFALTFMLSILFGPLWCRWLCPLGALYSLFGIASPCAVNRDSESCIHCHNCSEICHAFVDVESSGTVRSTECDGCMDCVKTCPVEGCLEAKVLGRTRIAPWMWPVLVVGVWLIIYGIAKATGNWDTTIPVEAFEQIINSGLLESDTPGFF